MTYRIRGENRELGILKFHDHEPIVEGDATFKESILQALRKGITQWRHVWLSENQSAIIQSSVTRTDSNFPLALVDWLRRQGYEVLEEHPGVDKEFEELVTKISTDNPLHTKLRKHLPTATYLEKTFLLEILKKKLESIKDAPVRSASS